MSETNFNNFYLANVNVYELAGGVIPELAERVGVPLGQEPNARDLDILWNQLRPNKELRLNPEAEIERVVAYDFVIRSGIQDGMQRSIQNPQIGIEAVEAVIATGGVLNWMRRGMETIMSEVSVDTEIYLPAGNRKMKSLTEVNNDWVIDAKAELGDDPEEWLYVHDVILPELTAAGYEHVYYMKVDSGKGDDIMQALFDRYHVLAWKRVAALRVTNAELQLAAQIRRAARRYNPDFDNNPTKPQAYAISKPFPLARDEAEDGLPTQFQRVSTAILQLPLVASVVHELSTAE